MAKDILEELRKWVFNEAPQGYSIIPLSTVLGVLGEMGYQVEHLAVSDLSTPSRPAFPGMGGGYTALGMYAGKVEPKKVYVRRGKIFQEI